MIRKHVVYGIPTAFDTIFTVTARSGSRWIHFNARHALPKFGIKYSPAISDLNSEPFFSPRNPFSTLDSLLFQHSITFDFKIQYRTPR